MNFYPSSLTKIPSVSELTQSIKDVLEDNFTMITVQGEVSQPLVSSNGHLYFTLKDDSAQISCVMWRATRMKTQTQLVQGQQITAFGSVKVYAPRGSYQLLVEQVQQAGVGALQAAFERLKNKLEAEGLFDLARKKSIPKFPKAIGVITSETSAAWHDIAINIEKRWPAAVIRLYHASTQGAMAAPQLVKALNYFTLEQNVDTIIIGRGGGSIEDLWPFNEEAVARAIATCPIPVISGVGHETDFTISDFVADVRANTPTQAAVIATPDKHELNVKVDDLSRHIRQSIVRKWQLRNQWVQRLIGSYALQKLRSKIELQAKTVFSLQQFTSQLLDKKLRAKQELVQKMHSDAYRFKLLSRIDKTSSRIRDLKQSIDGLISYKTNDLANQLLSFETLLRENNPLLPMQKGFTRIIQEGKMIKSSEEFEDNLPFEIHWKDGIKHVQ